VKKIYEWQLNLTVAEALYCTRH